MRVSIARRKTVHILVLLIAGLSLGVVGQAQNTPPADLTQMNLEDLMNVKVTSVSKREQKLSRTAAAVFVINQDDIRRSGATNIPDLLRMAPGVDVTQINANRWAISIRGFNYTYGNKVLVLVDGRTVYLDSSSNVFWDQVDVPLEDIDHIEVIRGSGGTLWGANAVNGVISIATKSAKSTQGGLIRAGGGSKESADGLAQYGGEIGSKGTYRAFGQYFNVGTSQAAGGQNAGDGWHGSNGGFRSDWDLSSRDALTVQGDLLRTSGSQTANAVLFTPQLAQQTFDSPLTNATGDALGKWDHTLRNGSEMYFQAFYDFDQRNEIAQVDETHNMLDFDFQHRITLNARNDLVWGLAYRYEKDRFSSISGTQFVPPVRSLSLYSAFAQDEITLNHALFLTVGSKFEHNDLTGFEYEPSVQLVWTPSDRHTIWTSAAHTVRQPSLADVGLDAAEGVTQSPNGVLAVPTLLGNLNVIAEQLREYEIGYRAQLRRRLALDLTGFWSFYRSLETVDPGTPFFALSPAPAHLVIPLVFHNDARAQDYGGEILANWDVNNRWKISPSYSLLHMSVQFDPASSSVSLPGDSPQHQFQVRSWFNVSKKLDWDSALMYVSALNAPGAPAAQGHLAIPSYTRVDTRLGWRLGESIEFSVAGQNLLRARHAEFFDSTGHVGNAQVERTIFGKLTWRF